MPDYFLGGFGGGAEELVVFGGGGVVVNPLITSTLPGRMTIFLAIVTPKIK